MNSEAEVIAIVAFNLLLLILAAVAWRLLRTKSSTVDVDEALESSETSSDAILSSVETTSGASAAASVPDGASHRSAIARGASLPVPAALQGPIDPEVRSTGLSTGPDGASRGRFVPGGVPVDGSVPDFTLALNHLFTADNGVLVRKRNSSAQPIMLSIQAGPRPVTPLLERVVEALTNIGLEPSQTRPLVHSFTDAAGRSARVRLAHSAAHGDLIEIEIEPSISPSAMASVMSLLSDLEYDPGEIDLTVTTVKGSSPTPAPTRQF